MASNRRSESDESTRRPDEATQEKADASFRPADHYDSDGTVTQPSLGVAGWLRWMWRQLTSMRTALFLLLLLAIAAVPGSLVPQRSSDPNGVTQYFVDNPDLAPLLDKVQAFDTYTSAWFSSIYLLLFISLIGCIIPRTRHHFQAMRSRPPRTPARLQRLAGYTVREVDGASEEEAVASAHAVLRRAGYRVERYDDPRGRWSSVSAERGYLRETGNLVFHSALVGILVAVGVGGGFGYSGQRVLVEGTQGFANNLAAYDSFNPGRFFDSSQLDPYQLTLDDLEVTYEEENQAALGQPVDFTAHVSTTERGGSSEDRTIKVNDPLSIGGTNVYLLGNGYAPTITVRDPSGTEIFTDSIPFLPQDANLTSVGVVKIPDGLSEQLGLTGFFYPTQDQLPSGASTSIFPDLQYPVLSLNVFAGDLGLDGGVPTSVYVLNTDSLTRLTGGDTGVAPLTLKPGDTAELPNGLGSVTFDNVGADQTRVGTDSVKRFASFDIHHDATQSWVLLFAILVLAGLLTSLFVPRRRVWMKATTRDDGGLLLEYAGLARGEDPQLVRAVRAIADRHAPLDP
ncbi:cytochrome c biogenesis protein ResB [Rathayibacter tanaceti]|uniref:Cytochrome c biogenesis protein Ccs1 n=2 Tax=Rathayibacter tanaceti TaxID=1671680 RepID=A0A162FWU9_9MICO|nr:cytochrome c biogenesis protein ResB [Rathayibacter tanaceti]KZX20720.1 Cytochrome c biogenesis protein Ccs1 [Rathayibacter tanaceti]QHC54698.1 cytochrome c biogenesis protein ResB [Rathayibacter tanaceti]TCO37489.1 cytochrome c biogenesis protein [Rathayibacter tanaceti]